MFGSRWPKQNELNTNFVDILSHNALNFFFFCFHWSLACVFWLMILFSCVPVPYFCLFFREKGIGECVRGGMEDLEGACGGERHNQNIPYERMFSIKPAKISTLHTVCARVCSFKCLNSCRILFYTVITLLPSSINYSPICLKNDYFSPAVLSSVYCISPPKLRWGELMASPSETPWTRWAAPTKVF